MSRASIPGLASLARQYGIQTAFYDVHRRRKEASPQSLLATLRALGAPVETYRDIPEALRLRHRETWTRMVEPILVAWDGGPVDVEIRHPSQERSRSVEIRLETESGDVRLLSRPAGAWALRRSEEIGGTTYDCRQIRLPGGIPWGYHRLWVSIGARVAQSTLISAPREAYSGFSPGRLMWGVFVPLYAIHSERSWGAGDFSDLEALMEWTASRGGSVLATLPFLASFLDEPFEPSPYSPASRLFWNELYVDATRAPEWEFCREARALREAPSFQSDLELLRSSPKVDYRLLMARKRDVVERLAQCASRGQRKRELDRFVASHPLVERYARFRATMERLRTPWTDWPSRLREGDLRPGDYREKNVRYHLYAQWLAEQQVGALAEEARRRGILFYLDLPLGVHPHGFDDWQESAVFVRAVSVGAPPDPVFTGGQNWSFHPLHPQRSRETAHQYFAECIRHQLRYAGMLRIDHVMGLHRLFWIPEGADFRDGVYVRYPAEELYAVLCLESHRHRSTLVGENLGIVPAFVNQAMARHNIHEMFLMQYALRADPHRPLKPIPSRSVVSLNSHDTPTFAAFWKGLDIRDRLALHLLDPQGARKERRTRLAQLRALLSHLKKRGMTIGRALRLLAVLGACIGRLRASRAGVVLINLEDLWLETKPQNVPGAGARRPNWQRRARHPLEKLTGLPGVRELGRWVDRPAKGPTDRSLA